MKGLDKLINDLATDSCPAEYDLNNTNEIDTTEGCLYGDGGNVDICKDCWRKSLEMEYTEA